MSSLQKPKNDYAKALYILMDNYMGGVSMAKVLNSYDYTFYKFQTRLAEVEREHPKLKISRTMIPYVSRLDSKKKKFMQYTIISPKPYVSNLYNKLNNEGFKGKTNTPNAN